MKRHLIFALLISNVVIVPVTAQDKELHELSGKLSAGLLASGKKNVAVVDFTDLQGCVTELGRYMAEEFSASLAEENKGFQVVDRTNLNVILKENHLAEKGIIDPSAARKIGQIAGVDAIISGTLTPLGDAIHVVVKVLDSTSARVMTAARGDVARTKGIDELLLKGVANCAGKPVQVAARGNISSQDDQVPAYSPNEISTLYWGEVVLKINMCRLTGNQVRCTGTIVNTAKTRFNIAIDGASMIDNLGNQNLGAADIQIGTENRWHDLEPDIPLKWSVQATGFTSDLSSVSVSLVCCSILHNETQVFRNLPVVK